jgi:hypothetical protein
VPTLVRLTGECFLRAHHAELISLGIGKYCPRLITSLADVNAACSEREKAINLLIAVLGAACQVDMNAVLDRLWIGDRHEADPDGRVVVGPDDNLAFALRQDLPAKRLGPEPGQRRKIVGVDHDVVKAYRHTDSLLATRRRSPANPHSSAACRSLLLKDGIRLTASFLCEVGPEPWG